MSTAANGIMEGMDSTAAAEFEIVKMSSGVLRRSISTVFSLLSLSSTSATLPQWHKYEIRERTSGAVLRTVNEAPNGRDIAFELQRDLTTMTASEFARAWKLQRSL